MRPVINSIKNQVTTSGGVTSTVNNTVIAKAVDNPVTTVNSDVQRGCIIKAIYLSLDVCGLAGTGVLNIADMIFIKSPGNNIVVPSPRTYGTSNEKKFVIKTWRAMIMRNQDGNVPYHWEGWIKIPKRYWRMGTDDIWYFSQICSSGATGHFSVGAIYKWYT